MCSQIRARLVAGFVFAALIASPVAAARADQPGPAILEHVQETSTADFDQMVQRRTIRVLTVFSQTMYFLDGAEQRGITYDLLQVFEKHVNQALGKKAHVQVVVIPVARDQLLPALIEGRGDIAAANLTITPGRQKLVEFSDPLLTGISELLVTGPATGEVASLDELAAKTAVYVRPSSSYYERLAD